MRDHRFDGHDLTRRILAATSGAACARAERLIAAGDAADGDPLDRELLAAHLDGCAPCRDLARALAWALPLLPALAERDPGPAFTAAVLARTARRAARGPVPALERLALAAQARLAALVERPRLALEAGWVAAVLAALMVWSPIAPAGAADHVAAAVQDGSAAVPSLVLEAQDLAASLARDIEPVVQGLRERAARAVARGHSLWHTIVTGES